MKHKKKAIINFILFLFVVLLLFLAYRYRDKFWDVDRFSHTDDTTSKPEESGSDTEIFEEKEESGQDILPGEPNLPTESTSQEESNQVEETPPIYGYIPSEEFTFIYEGSNYRYGITKDGQEVISSVYKDGYIDVLSGGGTYFTYDEEKKPVGVFQEMDSFLVEEKDGKTVVTVHYVMTDGSESTTAYTMCQRHININAKIEEFVVSEKVKGAEFQRDFWTDYETAEFKVAEVWNYPESGDFPHRLTDSIATIFEYKDQQRVYSFARTGVADKLQLLEDIEINNLPVTVAEGQKGYEIEYDLVFESDVAADVADAKALFESRDMGFAAHIQTVSDAQSKATIFFGDRVDLNLHIENLLSQTNQVQVEYFLYDYYGNLHASENLNCELKAEECKDIAVGVTSQIKGIYFLDLKVQDEKDVHREFFTFAVVPEYVYQERESSAFGVSGVRFGTYEPNEDTVWLLNEIGASNIRSCFSLPDYLAKDYELLEECMAKMTEKGIRVNGQFLLLSDWSYPSAEKEEQYKQELENALASLGKYLSSCELGNEYNLSHSAQTMKKLVQEYKKDYFNIGYETLKGTYAVDVISAAVGLSKKDWMTQLGKTGLLNEQDIYASHAYGYPHSPDYTDDPGEELVVESALVRNRKFLDTYGDKTWFLNEIGYPTTATYKGKSKGVDLRTQADYMVRANILGLLYGADEIETYCLYDQQNLVKGYDPTNDELHFGLFYGQDFYGRIMPKVSGIAYRNMTMQLDGISSCQEIATDSKTLRVFQMETEKVPLYVAWSNCKLLSNDKKKACRREANMPWQNEWTEEEIWRLKTDASQVEVIDSMGNVSIIDVTDGVAEINVNGSPKYIKEKER